MHTITTTSRLKRFPMSRSAHHSPMSSNHNGRRIITERARITLSVIQSQRVMPPRISVRKKGNLGIMIAVSLRCMQFKGNCWRK